MANQFEQDFIQAEEDPTPEGHQFRSDAGKIVRNVLADNSPGAGGDILKSDVRAIVEAAVPQIVAGVVAALYQPDLNAVWLTMEKLVQGTDTPNGMNAAQLKAAFVALLRG